MTTPNPPAEAQWTPPAHPGRPASTGRAPIVLAAIGVAIAVAALVVGIIALTRSTSSASSVHAVPTTPAAPTFTAEQAASAKKNLCTVYQVAARSVKADTNGTDIAIARVSVTNAAGMLEASDNPALGQSERDAARTLASAYRTVVAVSSVSDKSSPVIQSALDDANRADAAMAAICP